MHRSLPSFAVLVLLATAPLVACGGDREERGLTPETEVATPETKQEMGDTEAQRQEQVQKEIEEPAAKPAP